MISSSVTAEPGGRTTIALTNDPEFDTRTGHTTRTQTVSVGTGRIMVLRMQVDHGASRFGQPVRLPEVARVEQLDTPREHLFTDRRCPVDEYFKT